MEVPVPAVDSAAVTNVTVPEVNLVKNIVNIICSEKRAFFCSQQIGEPDLSYEQKAEIVESVLNESHINFLSRFGSYLTPEELKYFENNSYTPEENYEIKFYLNEIRKTHYGRKKLVKNRRYAAMQKMLKETNYFSDVEMMCRDPLLYEQFVGQYMTDSEKLARDREQYSEFEGSFVNVLMEGINRDNLDALKKKLESEQNVCDENSQSTKSGLSNSDDENDDFDLSKEDYFPKKPDSFRQQWGNFDDEVVSTSGNKAPNKKLKVKKTDYITAEERDTLKEEFVEIMYSKFLSGYDKDFDYSTVDDNSEYDNLTLRAQDEEDKYFDEDTMELSSENSTNMIVEADSCSEDELDEYMKKLSQDTAKL